MPETTSSTLSRVANVLGVSDRFASRGNTPIDNILKMQHFTLWGFIVLVVVVGLIIWLVQKKLDSIDKQYKEQYILLHRLFKSHQDLQVKVHVAKAASGPADEQPQEPQEPHGSPEEEPQEPQEPHGSPEETQEEDVGGFRDSSSLVGESLVDPDEPVDVDAY